MVRQVQKLLAPLVRRIRLMVNRAVIHLVNDTSDLQELQIRLLAEETMDGVERIQEYGFTSIPLPGAEAVALAVGGRRAHTIVIATDDGRYRLKALQGGEVALYDDQGQVIKLARDGIRMTAPKGVFIEGNVNVTGTVTATSNVIGGGISLKTHTHPGDSGGTTGVPNS